MASESGGRANKLGNEYERLWVVRHLIELIAGRAVTVRVECLGDDNMDDLLSILEDYDGPLKDYAEPIFAIADRLAGPLAAEARDHQTQRPFDASVLAKVLLRLYEQADNERQIRRRCLDAWDGLLAQRIGLDRLKDLDA